MFIINASKNNSAIMFSRPNAEEFLGKLRCRAETMLLLIRENGNSADVNEAEGEKKLLSWHINCFLILTKLYSS